MLDEGSYYAVGWVGVYCHTTQPGEASALNRFKVGVGDVGAAPGSREWMIPELLRRTADVIEGLGEVEVDGLVLHDNNDMDGIGRGTWISVYYRDKNG